MNNILKIILIILTMPIKSADLERSITAGIIAHYLHERYPHVDSDFAVGPLTTEFYNTYPDKANHTAYNIRRFADINVADVMLKQSELLLEEKEKDPSPTSTMFLDSDSEKESDTRPTKTYNKDATLKTIHQVSTQYINEVYPHLKDFFDIDIVTSNAYDSLPEGFTSNDIASYTLNTINNYVLNELNTKLEEDLLTWDDNYII